MWHFQRCTAELCCCCCFQICLFFKQLLDQSNFVIRETYIKIVTLIFKVTPPQRVSQTNALCFAYKPSVFVFSLGSVNVSRYIPCLIYLTSSQRWGQTFKIVSYKCSSQSIIICLSCTHENWLALRWRVFSIQCIAMTPVRPLLFVGAYYVLYKMWLHD